MTGQRPAPSGVVLSRHRITPEASSTIDAWAWGLADGSLTLQQLPDALVTLWTIAFEQGRASREQEVLDAKHDADRLWLRCFGDKDRQEYLLDRLDRAADLANRPGVDDVLDEAWRIYLASLDQIREPIKLTTAKETKEAA